MKLVFKRRESGCTVLTLMYKSAQEAQEAFSRALKVRQWQYIIELYL